MSTGPMTEERLKEIEARQAEAVDLWCRGHIDDVYDVASEDVPAIVAEVRRLQGAMVEIRRHVAGDCGHKRRPDQIGACLTAIRDLALGEPPKSEGT